MKNLTPHSPPATSRFKHSFSAFWSPNLYLFLVTILILFTIGLFVFSSVEKEMKNTVAEDLKAVLSSNEKSLRFWLKDTIRDAEVLAGQPEIREKIISLIQVAKNEDVTAQELKKTKELIWLREHLEKACKKYGFIGFVIFDPTGYQVGALLQDPVGKRQLIERSDFFYRSLQGDSVVSHPFPGEVDLPDNQGVWKPNLPTMFASTPVRDKAGEVVGVLAFRISPETEFTHMLDMGRIGKTGETFAFNDQGTLLTHSRFFTQMKGQGFVSNEANETSILNVQLLEPEKKLNPKANDSNSMNRTSPPTKMAASAVKGESGLNVNGYIGYRGMLVVGAWTWLPEHYMGLATEVEAEEAFGPLNVISQGFITVFGLLFGATLVAFLMRLKQARMEKERNQALEKALEREIRIRALVDYAQDGILTLDRDGFIESLNPAAESLFGYHSSEVLDKNISILLHKPHRKNFDHFLKNFLKPNKIQDAQAPDELEGLRKNGSIFYLEISVSSMVFKGRTKFVCLLRDITGRKKAEEKLRMQAKFQTAITQLGHIALAGTNLQDLINQATLLVKQTLEVTYAKTLKFMPEKNAFLLISGQGWNNTIQGQTVVPGGKGSQAGYTIQTLQPVVVKDLNQETRFSGPALLKDHGVVSGISVIIRTGARPFGVLGAHTDQSRIFTEEEIHFMQSVANVLSEAIERKNAEGKLRHYAKILERSNQELEDFAFIASHDLQEPLRKVMLFGDRIKETYPKDVDRKGEDYINRLQKSMSRMQTLIQDLLEFSRVTRSSAPAKSLNLEKVCAQVVSNLQMQIEETQGSITIESLPVIQGDKTQMVQLFQNLISNSIKYRRQDIPPEIQIRCSPKGENAWEIEIEDNGIGIDEKYFSKIFKPFERLHNADSLYKGSGIGLAICAKVVAHHHGEIRVRSQPGQGTTVIITLPRTLSEDLDSGKIEEQDSAHIPS